MRTDDSKLFVTSTRYIHNTRFIINGTEYMFSERGSEYEIRKLSNTFNANVIFSIDLKTTRSIGYSNDYNTADLRLLGYNVGIKTVELNKFPIIHKVAHRPELINIKRTEDTIILCGLATIDVLNNYQDDDLILSPALRRRGTKTGFYGFEHLLKIETLSDIDKVLNGSRKAQRKYWF